MVQVRADVACDELTKPQDADPRCTVLGMREDKYGLIRTPGKSTTCLFLRFPMLLFSVFSVVTSIHSLL